MSYFIAKWEYRLHVVFTQNTARRYMGHVFKTINYFKYIIKYNVIYYIMVYNVYIVKKLK